MVADVQTNNSPLVVLIILSPTAFVFVVFVGSEDDVVGPTDDQIDFEISGADDFTMTANTFTILAGSTIVNSGTMAPDITSTGKALVFGF